MSKHLTKSVKSEGLWYHRHYYYFLTRDKQGGLNHKLSKEDWTVEWSDQDTDILQKEGKYILPLSFLNSANNKVF